ncbi:MAG: hypothetical protein GX766_08380 [Firmicutes bacterium]|nr:hypothetical protein [Bacillota bacterium]HOB22076.1 YkoF family thiamine/hydroxymethylpyrimidine-binding protein [Bacillota bacterium]HQD40243.1 YkoF family thiamine/hydroxymethylpyrimidine-binding protein [Bacillota bacterium]
MIACEVSLYPLEVVDSDGIIQSAVLELDGVEAKVGELSTYLEGSEEEVFRALRNLYNSALRQGGEVAMVATIKNR